MKKALSLFLALMLCIGILAVPASAEEDRKISNWVESGQPETGLIMFSEVLIDKKWAEYGSTYTRYGLKRADGSIVYPAEYYDIDFVNGYIVMLYAPESGAAIPFSVPLYLDMPMYVRDLQGNIVYQTEVHGLGSLTYLEDINAYMVHLNPTISGKGDNDILLDGDLNEVHQFVRGKYIGDGYFHDYETDDEDHYPSIYKYAGGSFWRLPLDYRFINYTENGMFKVMNAQGKEGIVDENNNAIVSINYEWINTKWENGCLRFGTFVNQTEKDRYYDLGFLRDDSIYVGFIDRQERVLVPAEYELLSISESGSISVGKWDGTYEKTGIFVNGSPDYRKHYVWTVLCDLKDLHPSKFRDVPATAYYADAVSWAIDNSITVGTSDTAFSPDATCTNAQILTFLWRAKGEPEPNIPNPYTGISESDYYYKAALWGCENGLIDNLFDPGAPCTRASTVTYLWKTAGSPADGSAAFTDVADSADYAQAVAWAVAQNITNGTDETHFSPDATCTRGQIVTFLYRDFA